MLHDLTEDIVQFLFASRDEENAEFREMVFKDIGAVCEQAMPPLSILQPEFAASAMLPVLVGGIMDGCVVTCIVHSMNKIRS